MHIIIDKKDSHIYYQANTLIIRQGKTKPQRIPLSMITAVSVVGNIQLATGLLVQLAKYNIPTAFLPLRSPAEPALLNSAISKRVVIRHRQHRVYANVVKRLSLARWVLEQKCGAYQVAIVDLAFAKPPKQALNSAVSRTISKLTSIHQISGLMGLEGALAAQWFSVVSENVDPNWGFTSRNRRPPRDPINALMSLSYTLFLAHIEQQLIARGLDPSIGYLHQLRPGRNGLALDVLEAFRPGLDLWLCNLIDSQIFTPVDFYFAQDGACRLKKEARKTYFQHWAATESDQANGVSPCALQKQIGGIVHELTIQLKAIDRA